MVVVGEVHDPPQMGIHSSPLNNPLLSRSPCIKDQIYPSQSPHTDLVFFFFPILVYLDEVRGARQQIVHLLINGKS